MLLHKAQQVAEEQGTKTTLKLPKGEITDSGASLFEVSAPPVLPAKGEE